MLDDGRVDGVFISRLAAVWWCGLGDQGFQDRVLFLVLVLPLPPLLYHLLWGMMELGEGLL